MSTQSPTNANDAREQNHVLAHDLRNSLSAILLYAEFLEASLTKLSLEDELQMARTIAESVKEMNALIAERFDREG